MTTIYETEQMSVNYYNADGSINFDAIPEQELAQFWANAKAKLIAMQTVEREFRDACVKRFFPNTPEDATGTKRYRISDDAEFKAVFGLDYKLPGEDEVNDVVDLFEAKGETGKMLADRLFKWKPSLSVTEYNNLPSEFKKLVEPIVTIKPKSVQVEIATPKSR